MHKAFAFSVLKKGGGGGDLLSHLPRSSKVYTNVVHMCPEGRNTKFEFNELYYRAGLALYHGYFKKVKGGNKTMGS